MVREVEAYTTIERMQKRLLVQKELPEKNTHVTYGYYFDEVTLHRGRKVLNNLFKLAESIKET